MKRYNTLEEAAEAFLRPKKAKIKDTDLHTDVETLLTVVEEDGHERPMNRTERQEIMKLKNEMVAA